MVRCRNRYTSTDQLMSDASAKAIIDDLVMALPDITGSEYRNLPTRHTTAVSATGRHSAATSSLRRFHGSTATELDRAREPHGSDGSVRSGQVYLDAGMTVRDMRPHCPDANSGTPWDGTT
jgi:hypothetical protein